MSNNNNNNNKDQEPAILDLIRQRQGRAPYSSQINEDDSATVSKKIDDQVDYLLLVDAVIDFENQLNYIATVLKHKADALTSVARDLNEILKLTKKPPL